MNRLNYKNVSPDQEKATLKKNHLVKADQKLLQEFPTIFFQNHRVFQLIKNY
jgi:hypothetical protein